MRIFRRISGLSLLLAVLLVVLPVASYGASSVYIQGIGSSSSSIAQYQGLTIVNDGTNPNTVLDITCGTAIMTNSTGAPQYATNISGTLNIANTGANGRRSGLALVASNWYSVYLISNGTTTATFLDSSIGTLTPAVPTLPSGYTYSLYLGDWFYNSSGQLAPMQQINNKFAFDPIQFDLAYCGGGGWNVACSFSVRAAIPSTATKLNGIANPISSIGCLALAPALVPNGGGTFAEWCGGYGMYLPFGGVIVQNGVTSSYPPYTPFSVQVYTPQSLYYTTYGGYSSFFVTGGEYN